MQLLLFTIASTLSITRYVYALLAINMSVTTKTTIQIARKKKKTKTDNKNSNQFNDKYRAVAIPGVFVLAVILDQSSINHE